MKKIMISIVLVFTIVGCQSNTENTNNVDAQYKEYMQYVDTLTKAKTFQEVSDEFDVRIVQNKTNKNNYRYDIIIDNPRKEMYTIKLIANIPSDDGSSFPTLGILESGSFSLIPNVVDKQNNIYKGINLSAICPYDNATITIYITFYNSKDSSDIQERFIMVNTNAS